MENGACQYFFTKIFRKFCTLYRFVQIAELGSLEILRTTRSLPERFAFAFQYPFSARTRAFGKLGRQTARRRTKKDYLSQERARRHLAASQAFA